MKPTTALLLALSIAACGPVTTPGGTEPTITSIQSRLFQQGGCTGCHFSPTASAKLDLGAGKSFAALVGKASAMTTWQGTQWEGMKLVEPGKPDESLLVVVLEQPAGIPAVMKMPQTGSKVPADRITAVRQWITDGALDN